MMQLAAFLFAANLILGAAAVACLAHAALSALAENRTDGSVL